MKLSHYRSMRTHLSKNKRFAGRNNQGLITVRHQGGGHKQLYRNIDWNRNWSNSLVCNFEYDPNRSSYLVRLFHENKLNEKESFSYILAPKGLKVFDTIQTIQERRRNVFLRPGDSSIASNFEAGDFIHNVEILPNSGGLFARAAGTYCQVLQHSSRDYIKVRLPSGSHRLISMNSKATLGILSNENKSQENLKKAGRSRWLNIRPTVRGVAMNPVDHPHGGGQGKTKGGRPSVTPNSRPTKGQPTRNKKKKNLLILTHRKK